MNRPSILLLLGAVALSGCAMQPQTGQSQADAETRAACRARAEEAYDVQNRAEIYSPAVPVNTPYSANYVPGMSDRGLSDLFVHERMVSDCIRNTGTGAERSESATPPPQK